MEALTSYYTQQKIIHYGPPPSLALRAAAVKIFDTEHIPGRLPNTVLGYGEDAEVVTGGSLVASVVLSAIGHIVAVKILEFL